MGDLTVGWLTSGMQSARDSRAITSLDRTAQGPTATRPGVVAAGGNPGDLVETGSMTAKVTPHRAVIEGSVSADQNPYPVVLEQATSLTFDDGEDQVDRVDRVVDRVYDNTYDNLGSYSGEVEIVKGDAATGNPGPMPPNSHELWRVTIPAGASAGTGGIPWSSAKNDRREHTVAAGGLLPVADYVERDQIEQPHDGLAVWNRAAEHIYVRSAGQWCPASVPVIPDLSWLLPAERFDGLMVVNQQDGKLYRHDATVGDFVPYPPPEAYDFALLERQELTSDESFITFTGINQAFRNLELVISGYITGNQTRDLWLRFNGDNSTNYSWYRHAHVADSSEADFARFSSTTLTFGRFGTAVIWPSTAVVQILNYSASDGTTAHGDGAAINNGTTAAQFARWSTVGSYNINAAITSISCHVGAGYGYRAGTVFSLYGKR